MTEAPHIVVGIITYGRPEGLDRLLSSLATLEPPLPRVSVVVVDNDAEGSARETVDAHCRKLDLPIRYAVEVERGIPAARNTVVRLAAESDYTMLAFVDDDEEVTPSWLSRLYAALEGLGCDVVTGPVVPRFEQTPPAWVLEGGFFERRRHTSGNVLDTAFTNNVLIRRRVFDEVTPHFDTGRALTGGTDAEYFRRAARAGMSIRWCDDAEVYEYNPISRTNGPWLLRRSFRTGSSMSESRGQHLGAVTATALGCAASARWLTQGTAETCIGVATGKVRRMRGLQHVAYGLGLVAGLTGLEYQEYRTTHGR